MDSNDKTSSIEDKHQLAWSQEIPNYGNKLLKRLDEFRKTTILYDVRVRAEGGEFNAHKVILAACGGIFRTYFVDEKKQMISSEITELSLDCPAQGLKPIIRFAYTGALVVTKRNAVATMIAAEVTKMKEVQEICAGIAVKEYGWIIHFEGERDATTIENLGKVLQMHVACFTASCPNGNHVTESDDDLPFAKEVSKEFPDQTKTYQRLAIKLKSAETIVKTTKLKPKQSAEQKPDMAEPTKDIPAIKAEAVELVNSKPPVPNARSVKSKSDEADGVKVVADDDKTNPLAPVPKEKTPKKPVTSPSPTVKAPDSVHPEPPRPPSGRSVNPKSDEIHDVKVAADNDKTTPFGPAPKDKTPKKPAAPPSPIVKAPESANPKPPRPLSGVHKASKSDEVGDVKIVAGDDKVHLPPHIPNEKTFKKPAATLSPVVKAPDSANLKPPRPPSGAHKKSKSDEVGDVKFVAGDDKVNIPPPVSNEKTPKKPSRPPNVSHKKSKSDESAAIESKDANVTPISNEQAPKKRSPPPTPKSKPPEPASPTPPMPIGAPTKSATNAEKDGLKITHINKENEPAAPASTEGILKKQALPPSPRVKPRNSLKSKKSVPAPPPPSTADKSPKAAPPPRPTKAPAKVPPPRPRPPAAKKNSNPSEQGGSPAKKEVADHYDDKLNPFA